MVRGNIVDSDLLIKHLKRAKQKASWHGNRVNLCLNNQACYLRQVTMPEMTGREMSRAMRLEAEKLFPLIIDQAVIAYALINKRTVNGAPAGEYLLAAVSKEIADVYTLIAVKAGFSPASLGVAPLTILQSARYTLTSDHPNIRTPFILIDCGAETTSLLITADHGYLFHRYISIGLNHFIRAVKVRESLNQESAEQQVFSSKSLAQKGLLDLAGKLSRSVAQTLEYYFEHQNHAGHILPSTIAACGGGIFIPGLAAHLQNDLQLKLVLYNPLHPFKNNSAAHRNVSKHEGALFTTAHGLALKGWS